MMLIGSPYRSFISFCSENILIQNELRSGQSAKELFIIHQTGVKPHDLYCCVCVYKFAKVKCLFK